MRLEGIATKTNPLLTTWAVVITSYFASLIVSFTNYGSCLFRWILIKAHTDLNREILI